MAVFVQKEAILLSMDDENEFRSVMHTIMEGLTAENIQMIRYLCKDAIPDGREIISAFSFLEYCEAKGLIDPADMAFLAEVLYRINRHDLLKKLPGVKNRHDYEENFLRSGHLNFTPFRVACFHLLDELTTNEFEIMKNLCKGKLSVRNYNRSTDVLLLLKSLEEEDLLCEDDLEFMLSILKRLDNQKPYKTFLSLREGDTSYMRPKKQLSYPNFSSSSSSYKQEKCDPVHSSHSMPFLSSSSSKLEGVVAPNSWYAADNIKHFPQWALQQPVSGHDLESSERTFVNVDPLLKSSSGDYTQSNPYGDNVQNYLNSATNVAFNSHTNLKAVGGSQHLRQEDLMSNLQMSSASVPITPVSSQQLRQEDIGGSLNKSSASVPFNPYSFQQFGQEELSKSVHKLSVAPHAATVFQPRQEEPLRNQQISSAAVPFTNQEDQQAVEGMTAWDNMPIADPDYQQSHRLPQEHESECPKVCGVRGMSQEEPLTQDHSGSPSDCDQKVMSGLHLRLDDGAGCSPLESYSIENNPCGICLIINNEKFEEGKNLKTVEHRLAISGNLFQTPNISFTDRCGSSVDVQKLTNLFQRFGFEIRLHENLGHREMSKVLKECSRDDHSKYDCFVCVIMSHGLEGSVYGIDGMPIKTVHVHQAFNPKSCPTLLNKPKLFFFQACQGDQRMAEHPLPEENVHEQISPVDDVEADSPLSIPSEADFLISHSTVPGFLSYRDKQKGSWFISTLVENLEKYHQTEDILSILIKVNNEMATKPLKQMPMPVATLRKKVFFTSKHTVLDQSFPVSGSTGKVMGTGQVSNLEAV